MLDGRSESIAIVASIFLATSLVTVLLRCFVRVKIMRAFGWDDRLMVLVMASNVIFAIRGIVGAHYEMGKRLIYFVTQPDHLHRALLCWWLGQVLYIITCVIAKLSIIITLLRVVVDRIYKWILYAAMTATVIVGLLFFFFTIFQCHPINLFWNRFSKPGTCIDPDILMAIAYVYSVGAAFTDFTVGLLLVLLIWNLRMNLRANVVGIGYIASSAVIVRILYLQNYKDYEFLYATTSVSIWSNVEGGLGITAGSLTTLRPLFRLFREGSSASRDHGRNPGSFPLSSTLGKNAGGTGGGKGFLSSPDPHDETQQLWPSSADNDNCHGVRTVITGNPWAKPASSSKEDSNLTAMGLVRRD